MKKLATNPQNQKKTIGLIENVKKKENNLENDPIRNTETQAIQTFAFFTVTCSNNTNVRSRSKRLNTHSNN